MSAEPGPLGNPGPSPSSTLAAQSPSAENLDLVRAIPVELSVRLGSITLAIQDILQLRPGAVVQLDASVGRSVDVLANGLLIGQGELVLVNENYGVRLTRMLNQPGA